MLFSDTLKKILIFSQSFEPAHKGGGVPQSLVNLVKNLGHLFQFYVITLNHEYRAPKEVLEGIVTNEWINFYQKGKVIYLTRQSLNIKKVRLLMLSVQPDIVYLNGFHELYFVIVPLYISKQLNIKVVMAPRGLLQEGALAIKSFKKKAYLKLFKLLNLHDKVKWHATDPQEIQDIKKIFGADSEVVLAKDTPDLTEYSIKPIIKECNCLKLVTVSLLAPKKNHILVLKVLSELNIEIEYDIYGPIYDQQYWQICESFIHLLPANIKVTYKGGVVPKDVNLIFSQYHFLILPTLGENFGHVIFEALHAGRPVIISNRTPWQNLEQQSAGWDVSLSNKDYLKEAIIKAYQMNQQQFNELSKGAYQMARNFVQHSNYEDQYKILFC